MKNSKLVSKVFLAAVIVAGLSSGPMSVPVAMAQQQEGTNPQAMQDLLRVIKKEPTIKEVQRAALKFYKLEPERIQKLVRLAKLKGLMPDITATFENSVGNDFSNMKDGLFPSLPDPVDNPNPNSYKERRTTANDNTRWSVSGRFDLSRLVFSSEALDAKSLTTLEENLTREITTLYFSRRRVLASIFLNAQMTDEEMFYTLTRLDEMTATIDAFSGGMFTARSWNWEKELLGEDPAATKGK